MLELRCFSVRFVALAGLGRAVGDPDFLIGSRVQVTRFTTFG
jgi:hypothetical protein